MTTNNPGATQHGRRLDPIRTRVTDLLGIDYPIIQAPMVGAGGVDMTDAVSKAGALGTLGCAAAHANKGRDGRVGPLRCRVPIIDRPSAW